MQNWELPDGSITYKCPKECFDYDTARWLDWHKHYLNGLLPVSGGLLDQAAMYYEAMSIIEGA